MPNRISRGQVFAFSGLAGDNSCRQDLCGVLTGEGGEIRFAPAAAAELQCMHRIYMTLDDHMSALQMDELSRALAERINMRLWDGKVALLL